MRVEIVTQLEADALAEVRALLEAARRHDAAESIGEHKFLRVSSGSGAPGVKALLGYQGESLAGYANVEVFPLAEGRRLSGELVVHPSARRQGAGSTLLEAMVAQARELSAERVDVWAYHQLPGARELAAKFGFAPSRTLFQIRMPLPERFPEAPLPEGVNLRAFREGQDEQEWLTLNNLVFSTHPEQGSWDEADLAARLRQPWFDAADFLLAERSGRLVAYNWLKLDHAAREGEIYVIGVHPDERRQRFGRSLTILGLAHMRQRGMTEASAYVDGSNGGALAMYEALGFTQDHADIMYSKSLT